MSHHQGKHTSIGNIGSPWSEDRIPVGARFSAPVQTGPGTHPASYTMGAGSFFPGGKAAGAWCPPFHI